MSITIKDVAQRSGVSVVTVSKYLNGVSVRQTTADKIAKAIAELGYRPNLLARGLRNSCSMTIGILVGVPGLILVALAYPSYRVFLRKERQRIAPEILRLSEELLK